MKYLLAAAFIISLVLAPAIALAQYGNPTDAVAQSPVNLLTLITKKISVGAYEPTDLVALTNFGAPTARIRAVVMPDLQALMTDASTQNAPLSITSAYRSYDDQVQTYNEMLAQNPKLISTVAQPGYSEHQLGTAIDFGAIKSGNNATAVGFANTVQSQWLAANAYKYGFAQSFPANGVTTTGYVYEPWHWRYIGRDAAAAWKSSGLILQTYLSHQPQSYITISLANKAIKGSIDPTVYFAASNGSKRGFTTAQSFLSYGLKWEDVLVVVDTQVQGFPNTKVVKAVDNPTVYLLDDKTSKRPIASVEAFMALGYNWNDVVSVNSTELSSYANIEIIK